MHLEEGEIFPMFAEEVASVIVTAVIDDHPAVRLERTAADGLD